MLQQMVAVAELEAGMISATDYQTLIPRPFSSNAGPAIWQPTGATRAINRTEMQAS
jgi:hypothetical protein